MAEAHPSSPGGCPPSAARRRRMQGTSSSGRKPDMCTFSRSFQAPGKGRTGGVRPGKVGGKPLFPLSAPVWRCRAVLRGPACPRDPPAASLPCPDTSTRKTEASQVGWALHANCCFSAWGFRGLTRETRRLPAPCLLFLSLCSRFPACVWMSKASTTLLAGVWGQERPSGEWEEHVEQRLL